MATRDPIRLPYFTGGLLALLALLAVYSLHRGPVVEENRRSEGQLSQLRLAVSAYHIDHGFYPGSRRDFGYPLSSEQLRAKLLQYSDAGGQSSPTKSNRFRFGPYLDDFPADSVFGSHELSWALGESPEFAADEEGGWIYAPEKGEFVARIDGLQGSGDLARF